jgi:predicted exporter
MNPALVAEEQRVRERISRTDASRFLVASGENLEAALAANDRLHARLLPLVQEGSLGGFRSLHAFLWSEALQRENLAVLRDDPGLPERLERAYTAEGFRPGSFQGFAAALAGPPAEPLRFADLAGSVFGDVVRPHVIGLGSRTGVVTLLEGVERPEALAAAVADQPDVRLFDQKRFFREVYGEYRRRIVGVVVSGCFAGLALLVVRYRALRPALAAALPSLLVAGLLVALAAATGTETHILHLIGLFLVIGIGGDFGIFLVDGVEDEASAGTTMLSLFVASCATILTFGVMGLSAHPVLSAIGRTTSIGIALSFLLAPVSLVLVAGERQARVPPLNRS